MILVENYIKQNREKRTTHLNLKSKCVVRGGNSGNFKGLLAHFLKTTIPETHKIYLCHACNNPKCSNPKHLYWGTPTDNCADKILVGTQTNLPEKLKEKYGEDFLQKHGKWLGKNFGGSNKLTKEQLEIYKLAFEEEKDKSYGWLNRIAKKLNKSHSQVRRIYNKYFVPVV